MTRNRGLSQYRVSAGLSSRDMNTLRLLAEREETSVSAVVRRILREYLQTRDPVSTLMEREAVPA